MMKNRSSGLSESSGIPPDDNVLSTSSLISSFNHHNRTRSFCKYFDIPKKYIIRHSQAFFSFFLFFSKILETIDLVSISFDRRRSAAIARILSAAIQ